jgi:hypothetical protein
MTKNYPVKSLLFISVSFLLFALASCKKDNSTTTKNNSQNTVVATPTTLGLYEADSGEYKELEIAVSQIGTQTVDYGLVFDTGSGGMVIDANGILPASMIGSNGFNFTTDSTTVNGITITNQTTELEYGVDNNTLTKVYGNLAYAAVTIGDQNGSVVIKRLPFFLYYKAEEGNGTVLLPHYFDTFGVSKEYITFSGSAFITSPFSYFDPGNGLTRGFKMAQLNSANFTYDGNYVPGAVTLGLTTDDLSSSSGFIMSPMFYYAGEGYDPILSTTVTYGGKSVSTQALFDTGTSGYSYIEDPNATSNLTLLPANTKISLVTNTNFSYTFLTGAVDNLTYVENPTNTGADFSDFSIEFFLGNEYLMDFTDNKLGLKNN